MLLIVFLWVFIGCRSKYLLGRHFSGVEFEYLTGPFTQIEVGCVF